MFPNPIFFIVKVWTPEMVTKDLNKMLESYGVSLGSANASAIIIQVNYLR